MYLILIGYCSLQMNFDIIGNVMQNTLEGGLSNMPMRNILNGDYSLFKINLSGFSIVRFRIRCWVKCFHQTICCANNDSCLWEVKAEIAWFSYSSSEGGWCVWLRIQTVWYLQRRLLLESFFLLFLTVRKHDHSFPLILIKLLNSKLVA